MSVPRSFSTNSTDKGSQSLPVTPGKTRRILFVAPRSISQRGIPSKFSRILKLLYMFFLTSVSTTPSPLPQTYQLFPLFLLFTMCTLLLLPWIFPLPFSPHRSWGRPFAWWRSLSTSRKHPAQGLSRCQYQTWSPLPPTCLLVSPLSQHGITSLGVLSQLSAQTQTHLWSAGVGREWEEIVFLLGRG